MFLNNIIKFFVPIIIITLMLSLRATTTVNANSYIKLTNSIYVTQHTWDPLHEIWVVAGYGVHVIYTFDYSSLTSTIIAGTYGMSGVGSNSVNG